MNPNQTNQASNETQINIDEEMESIKADMQARFGLLPEELQQAIMSNDYQMKLYDIAKKYKLTYEQLGKLEMETTLVLLGMTHPDEYGFEVSKAIKAKDDVMQSVIKEVSEQVFVPIRTTLMKLYTEESDQGEQPPVNQTPTSTEPIARKVLINSAPPATSTPVMSPRSTPLIQSTPMKVINTQTMDQPKQATPAPIMTSAQPVKTPIQQQESISRTGALEAYTQARPQMPNPAPTQSTRPQTYSPTPVAQSQPMMANSMPIPQAPYRAAATNTPQTSQQPTTPGISVAKVAAVLQNTVVSNPTVRTYTTPPTATTQPVANTPGGDLYREPVE